jgi:CubicO group peptidase (beta-lactamase class C family)
MNSLTAVQMLTPTKFSPFLAILTITLLVTGCGSQTSALPTITPITPTTTTLPSSAPTPTQTTEAQLASQIDTFLTDLTERDRFSGSILVAIDGNLVISQGYGMANSELDVLNTPRTKFMMGSVTKQFTAMAILQLQQQGKLSLRDPICRYIRDCPEAWQPITFHHLLTHTSGIPDYIDNNFEILKNQSLSPIKLIDTFRNRPLDFTPGERWLYSNSGYVVLGYVIEQVSGQPWALFLQKNIFEPLQMADTGYDTLHTIIKNRADGYFSATTNAEYIDPSVMYAAGGLYSTVEDLFRWEQALDGDQLISQPLRDEMFIPFAPIPPASDIRLTADVTDASYGYGWFIGKRLNRQWEAHTGHSYGFSSVIERYPDDKLVIIVLSNREARPLVDITSEIARMIFGEK